MLNCGRWNRRMSMWVRQKLFRVPEGALQPKACTAVRAVLEPWMWICWHSQQKAWLHVRYDFYRDVVFIGGQGISAELLENIIKEHGLPEAEIPEK